MMKWKGIMMIKPDKYLYVLWEDSNNIQYRVGILVRIDNIYYLKTCRKNLGNLNSPYSNGFNGIPSFSPGEFYESKNEIFEFFKRRIRKIRT